MLRAIANPEEVGRLDVWRHDGMVYIADLKSVPFEGCGFESHCLYARFVGLREVDRSHLGEKAKNQHSYGDIAEMA